MLEGKHIQTARKGLCLCCWTFKSQFRQYMRTREYERLTRTLANACLRAGKCVVCCKYAAERLFDNQTSWSFNPVHFPESIHEVLFRLHDFTPLCQACVQRARNDARRHKFYTMYAWPTLAVVLSRTKWWPRYSRMIRGSAELISAGQIPQPHSPTSAQPGSPEKIEIMRQRAAQGTSVFHEDDEQTVAFRERYDMEFKVAPFAIASRLPKVAYGWNLKHG